MFRFHRVLFAATGLAARLIGLAVVSDPQHKPSPSPKAPQPPPAATATGMPGVSDPAAVKAHAWQRAEPHLAEAERKARAALDTRLATIHAFIDERNKGARAFAEQLLGLSGKWKLIVNQIGVGKDSEYAAFLSEAFGEHVFKAEELEQAVTAAIKSYLAELDAIEQELLVRLRTDLADDEMPVLTVLPQLRSDQVLQGHYRELSERVASGLRTELAVVASREFFLWRASNIATDLTLQAGAAIAAQLGFSTTLLSAGAASSWQTLGVGLIVAIVLDIAVDRLIKAAGYDAEEKIAGRVAEMLSALGRTITDGDPDARDALQQLKIMQRDDPSDKVRAACAEAIQSLEKGTQLYGLRRELTNLAAARASLRKETLRRLIHNESEAIQ